MTRDWAIIRKILLKVEGDTSLIGELPDADAKVKKSDWNYNLRLLIREEFIHVDQHQDPKTKELHTAVRGLSWKGHDLLEMLRDKKLTRQILNGLSKKLTGVPFDVFKAAYTSVTKSVVSDFTESVDLFGEADEA